MKPDPKKQFSIFKKECVKWIRIFGMYGWEYTFLHCDLDTDAATCTWPSKSSDRQFALSLNKDLPNYSEIDIKRTAFHEVMEAFLYKISFLCEARYLQQEEIDDERHNIIRTLEKVIFDQDTN